MEMRRRPNVILILADNGGCAEFMAEDGWAKFMPDVHNDGRKIDMGNRPSLRPGGPLTCMSYDLPWANVSNAPFRSFKHWVHEGGISTPLVVQWPGHMAKASISHTPCQPANRLGARRQLRDSPGKPQTRQEVRETLGVVRHGAGPHRAP